MKTIVVCAALGLAGSWPAGARAEEPKKPVRTYTNEDLERVAPLKGETGALSHPAASPPLVAVAPATARSRDEVYWRREAARVDERLRALRAKADALRRHIAAARSADRRRPSTRSRVGTRAPAASIGELEARLAAVEREMRERQAALEERARRAGALPGWIR